MNKSTSEQERYCLDAKYLCELLRTKLFLIEDFKKYKFYSKQLEKISDEVNKIYWSL